MTAFSMDDLAPDLATPRAQPITVAQALNGRKVDLPDWVIETFNSIIAERFDLDRNFASVPGPVFCEMLKTKYRPEAGGSWDLVNKRQNGYERFFMDGASFQLLRSAYLQAGWVVEISGLRNIIFIASRLAA